MYVQKPEILAPAGSWESLVAAVYAGADAVYLGSKSLNARRNAGNFDEEELRNAVVFCHARGVKVYQTLNTVTFEHEIAEAMGAVSYAAELAIDGILVQDFGVANIARTMAPELPLFASTQMAVHNVQGALMAEELGFKRVVLAREMSREQMAAVTAAVGIETEVFVHGAHCMSLSGQCYMSAMIGGRSGNRGLCAQPCRLPFSPGNEGYALSLKDMSLMARVDELREIGISSFKIEGRMKRPEYVAAAVSSLKNAIAGNEVDFETLKSVFSRSGFSDGYFGGAVTGDMFGIRKKEDVVSAADVLKDLAKIYEKEPPKIPLDMVLTVAKDQNTLLTLTDGDGHTVTAEGEQPQIALNMPLTAEKVRGYLEKMGGTPFYLNTLHAEIGEGLMLPASAVNALRRKATEQLFEVRVRRESYPIVADEVPLPPRKAMTTAEKQFTVRGRLAQLSRRVLEQADRLILPIEDLLAGGEEVETYKEKLVVEVPRVFFSGQDKLLEQLAAVAALGVTRAWCGNIGAVHMAKACGLEPLGGFSLNATNSLALGFLHDLGIENCEVSIELPVGDLPKLRTAGELSAIVYGYLPLMAVRNCPIKAERGCAGCDGNHTLTDRTGVTFRVDCAALQKSEVAEIFNSVPLYLADRLDELKQVAHFVLYFTNESRTDAEEMFDRYRQGLPPIERGASYTRGLYYRKVQ